MLLDTGQWNDQKSQNTVVRRTSQKIRSIHKENTKIYSKLKIK